MWKSLQLTLDLSDSSYESQVHFYYANLPDGALLRIPAVQEHLGCPSAPQLGCYEETPPPGDCRMPGCPHQREMKIRRLERLRSAVLRAGQDGDMPS